MTQKFLEKGYKVVESSQKADIYVINTCTVTNISDRKSRQMIRRAKNLNAQAIIVACGCYVQVAKEEVEKMEEIDIVIGNNEKKDIVEIIENYINEKYNLNIITHIKEKDEFKTKIRDAIQSQHHSESQKNESKTEIQNVMQTKEYTEIGETTYTEKTRAVIKIQDGCDRFCTYCIIPYARGRVRSRNPQNIISEIKQIAKKGIKEVVITGIHVASYGKDFKEDYKLIDILEEIEKIEGIERIRLGSIEPLLITEEFVKRLTKLTKICHHFHLSLQSGCDKTLQRMNRKYTTEEFEEIVQRLRDNYKDVILTTDIIVGFPGETSEEFDETYKYLEKIKFYKMHVFQYSPRKGTKAAEMKEQINGKIKEERSQKLIEMSNKNETEYNKQYIGKKVEVLFEEKKGEYYQGHTPNYILVCAKSEKNLENKMENVICQNVENGYILAKIIM